MKRAHFIVLNGPDGPVLHPMKAWIRENPAYRPHGLSPDENTSHKLRRAYQRNGWEVELLPDRVLIIKPDESGDTSFADDLIGDGNGADDVDEEASEIEDITFGLERDLQAALRANIGQLEPGLTIIDGGKERSTQDGRVDGWSW